MTDRTKVIWTKLNTGEYVGFISGQQTIAHGFTRDEMAKNLGLTDESVQVDFVESTKPRQPTVS